MRHSGSLEVPHKCLCVYTYQEVGRRRMREHFYEAILTYFTVHEETSPQ